MLEFIPYLKNPYNLLNEIKKRHGNQTIKTKLNKCIKTLNLYIQEYSDRFLYHSSILQLPRRKIIRYDPQESNIKSKDDFLEEKLNSVTKQLSKLLAKNKNRDLNSQFRTILRDLEKHRLSLLRNRRYIYGSL